MLQSIKYLLGNWTQHFLINANVYFVRANLLIYYLLCWIRQDQCQRKIKYKGSLTPSLALRSFLQMYILFVSSWARYLVKPLRRTLSPSRWRNSSSAGPAASLLYISSSLLWPAMQYITPTFRWKLSCGENKHYSNEKGRNKWRLLCGSHVRVTMLTFEAGLMLTF